MRVDTDSGSGQTIYDGKFQIFLNFTSGIVFYVNENDKNGCVVHYLDYWNDWCYGGKDQSQVYVQAAVIGNMRCDVWGIDDFHFVNSQEGCRPVFRQRSDGSSTIYFDLTPLSDTSVFYPPSTCTIPIHQSKLPNGLRTFLHHPALFP